MRVFLGIATALLFFGPQIVQATPPHYKSFKQGNSGSTVQQKTSHQYESRDLMRIWVVYVGQGDGILIQLPRKHNYSQSSERIDVLVDAGAFKKGDQGRMGDFLENLYGSDEITIEHAVLSHHDSDHVSGLTNILKRRNIEMQAIYHNGLASYSPGKQNFPKTFDKDNPPNAVYKATKSKMKRGMAFLENDKKTLKSRYMIEDLATLRQRKNDFQGIYDQFANAILDKEKPSKVNRFKRAAIGKPFIGETEKALRGKAPDDVKFEVLWPRDNLTKYKGWSETINGNSVTFRLVYKNFEMLFTGDHNEHSEKHFLQVAPKPFPNCDVLKVPHHGSNHAYEKFFGKQGCRPIVSVASMGVAGAESKAFKSGSWQHPSTNMIKWLGGAHRVYHTFIHERRFGWPDLKTQADHDRLYEKSHVLIETDGEWFRVVEVPLNWADLSVPPAMSKVKRGDGTRWIKAN